MPDLVDDAVQVRPNPVTDRSRIYFSNGPKDTHTLTLTGMNGQSVWQASTRDDHFIVDGSTLAAGTYLFIIRSTDTGQVLSGKIVVMH